jgi:hypothetical protein
MHLLPLLAMTTLARAAIIEMYHDEGCWGYLGEVNVWDNTCASWMETEWKSFRVTAPGSWGQQISSYKHGVCVYPAVVCTSATQMGRCVDGYGRAFGSSLFEFCG